MFADEGSIPSRRAVLGAFTALGGAVLLGEGEAFAAPAPTGTRQPKVYTRNEWKAVAPASRAVVLNRAPDRIVVHHTASPNQKNTSLKAAFALSRSIQRFHMDSRGWNDTGQQLTISRGGHIMEGRNRSLEAIAAKRHAVGAQALDHNDHTIGIENEGTYMWADVPTKLWDSLADTCVWLCREYDLNPARAIVGHRDLGATDCPGDVLYKRLPQLRKEVQRRLALPPEARVTTRHLPGTAPGVRRPRGPFRQD